jgi:hypothetical protein
VAGGRRDADSRGLSIEDQYTRRGFSRILAINQGRDTDFRGFSRINRGRDADFRGFSRINRGRDADFSGNRDQNPPADLSLFHRSSRVTCRADARCRAAESAAFGDSVDDSCVQFSSWRVPRLSRLTGASRLGLRQLVGRVQTVRTLGFRSPSPTSTRRARGSQRAVRVKAGPRRSTGVGAWSRRDSVRCTWHQSHAREATLKGRTQRYIRRRRSSAAAVVWGSRQCATPVEHPVARAAEGYSPREPLAEL